MWRARVNWGVATNRVDVVQQALKHLPAAESTPAQIHRLNAWLCSKRGDLASNAASWNSLIAADPADATAARPAGPARRERRAAGDAPPSFSHRRPRSIGSRARYRKLYERTQPMRDAEEMARLAEQLGREFEARVFLTLAISDEPDREDLRRELERLIRKTPRTSRFGALFVDSSGLMQLTARSDRRNNDAGDSGSVSSAHHGGLPMFRRFPRRRRPCLERLEYAH